MFQDVFLSALLFLESRNNFQVKKLVSRLVYIIGPTRCGTPCMCYTHMRTYVRSTVYSTCTCSHALWEWLADFPKTHSFTDFSDVDF